MVVMHTLCNDRTVRVDVLMGYSVAGMQIVAMVRGRRIRVVWATTCRCQFPLRLVEGLAVTQGKESVSLGRSERVVLTYVLKKLFYDCPAIEKLHICLIWMSGNRPSRVI